jgi:hypothetical protein
MLENYVDYRTANEGLLIESEGSVSICVYLQGLLGKAEQEKATRG